MLVNYMLLFTNTGSLCIEIHSEDVYADIKKDVNEWFDTSNLPLHHPTGCWASERYDPKKFNFETIGSGKEIIEFAVLKTKMYSCTSAS